MDKHSNCTPMAYSVYRQLFEKHFEFDDSIENADVVILGFEVDLSGISAKLKIATNPNPNLKITILSEEPLWDCLNGGNFHQKNDSSIKDDYDFNYVNLNHVTTDILCFTNIPYFITTDDNYFLRYSFLFRNKSTLKRHYYISEWITFKKI
jgi:hypothetical protein